MDNNLSPQNNNPQPVVVTPPPVKPQAAEVKKAQPFKKAAINVMIGSLIGSALIAVAAVLVGEFNDTFAKALFTLLIVSLHALVCLGFLDSREKTTDKEDLKVFTNTIFVLIILSFVTAVFGIWGLFTGLIVAKLYGTYFIIAFATLHGEMLHKTTGVDSRIDKLVYSNYALMALVVGLLLPLLWLATYADFPDFYYRLLAAAAIIDATLTILAVIFHRLYIQKHPQVTSQLFSAPAYVVDSAGNRIAAAPQHATKRPMHPLLIILLAFLILQFVAPIIFFFIMLIAF